MTRCGWDRRSDGGCNPVREIPSSVQRLAEQIEIVQALQVQDRLIDRGIDVATNIDIGQLIWLWGNTVAQDVDVVARAEMSMKSPGFRTGRANRCQAA